MSFHGQSVLPAVRDMKQLEKFLVSNYEYGVLLDNQVGMLKGIMKEVHKHEKKLIIHLDLIHGLKHDEYAVDFLCQEFKPAGIISTRTNVILKAKQRGNLCHSTGLFIRQHGFEEKLRVNEESKTRLY